MLNKLIITTAYVVSGLESALKSTELADRAEIQACDMLTRIAPGKDVIADSAWTYSFLCSHLYIALLVQSWATDKRKAKAKELLSTAKDYVVHKLGFQTAVKPEQLLCADEECVTISQAAELLSCSTAKVLDLIASNGLSLVADDFVSQHSIDTYKQHGTRVSSFSATPPNNGSPNTSSSGGSR